MGSLDTFECSLMLNVCVKDGTDIVGIERIGSLPTKN